MAANAGIALVAKAFKYGACDFLHKPIRIEALPNIWHHFLRKRLENQPTQPIGVQMETSNFPLTNATVDMSIEGVESQEADEVRSEITYKQLLTSRGKTRVVWNSQLHSKFEAALAELGGEKCMIFSILSVLQLHIFFYGKRKIY